MKSFHRLKCTFRYHPAHRDLFAHADLSEVGPHAAAHLPYDHLRRLVLIRPLPCMQLVPDRPEDTGYLLDTPTYICQKKSSSKTCVCVTPKHS